MTREYRFTAQDILHTTDEDCSLSPDDPVYQALHPNAVNTTSIAAQEHFKRRELAQQKGIKPGTPAWHALFTDR